MKKALILVLSMLFLSMGMFSCSTKDELASDNDSGVGTPWGQYNSMAISRKRMDAAAIGNKIYVAGGDVYPSTATDAFEVYDINTNSWSTLTPISKTRMYLSSVSFNSQFYIFGGMSGAQYPYTKLAEINKYNPSSGSWSSLGNQYNGNTYMQQVSDPINNKVYWINGTSTYEFDLSTDSLTNCGSTCASLPTVTSG
jgi:N-acetylneuraminic acid mutarotase